MTNIKPLEDRVVVEPDKKEKTTNSGIVLPENAREKPQIGTVLAVGPGQMMDDGQRKPMDVSVGDRVLYSKYAGSEVTDDGTECLVLRVSDCLGIVAQGG